MESVPIAHPMHEPSDQQLRLRILRANSTHSLTSLGGSQRVHGDNLPNNLQRSSAAGAASFIVIVWRQRSVGFHNSCVSRTSSPQSRSRARSSTCGKRINATVATVNVWVGRRRAEKQSGLGQRFATTRNCVSAHPFQPSGTPRCIITITSDRNKKAYSLAVFSRE